MVLVNEQVCSVVIWTVFLVPLSCQTILELVKPFRNWSNHFVTDQTSSELVKPFRNWSNKFETGGPIGQTFLTNGFCVKLPSQSNFVSSKKIQSFRQLDCHS